MKRSNTGRYLHIGADGEEKVRAYLPSALPPVPPLELDAAMVERLTSAHLAVGRLDSASLLLPQVDLFLYMYVRKEALLSSQIEGTQSSLSDLLVFESEGVPGIPLHDVLEVSHYVRAIQHGVGQIRSGSPITNRLVREVHSLLLRDGRGAHSDPGEFRRSQVWLGGSRPGNAIFVPPPAHEVAKCMSDLERWINDIPQRTPTLIKAALAHVQFETIHPFLDGNGRVGRMMIILILLAQGMLEQPLLYLSLWLKQNRSRYYDLLTRVRTEGVWEDWLAFFAEGVEQTATEAVLTARRLVALSTEDRDRIKSSGRTASNMLLLHQALLEKPIASSASLATQTGLAAPTVNRLLDSLAALGIVREITGRQRDRLFSYEGYLEILSEGTEPL